MQKAVIREKLKTEIRRQRAEVRRLKAKG